ncbi:unnamed protein product [Pleuronectes platessa]|uniref:Uncharacterized protein n=1 Tax=Pleuronectes platessa TaxID=8262 RepID=A0A9N7TRM4_PLEPL|nr:unnamed protein product [Pleuronectes platessa]
MMMVVKGKTGGSEGTGGHSEDRWKRKEAIRTIAGYVQALSPARPGTPLALHLQAFGPQWALIMMIMKMTQGNTTIGPSVTTATAQEAGGQDRTGQGNMRALLLRTDQMPGEI